MATRTPLFNRTQPGGVFTISDVVAHPGDIWWVCSTTGVDGAGYGQNPDAPCATINYAYDLATASQGDVIYVMPGHNETLINATTLVVDKAGISIIGLGRGMNRPIIDFNHADAKISVSGQSTRLSNLIFRATITQVLLGIDVDAHDCEVDNCLWTWESTGDEFVTSIKFEAFDRGIVRDCVFDTEEASAHAVAGIALIDANDMLIQRNTLRGFWSGGAILGSGTLSARVLVMDNVIYNSNTAVYSGLDFGAVNTTGIVAGNRITSLYAAPLTKNVRVANTTWHTNTVVNAVAERAPVTIPTTTSV